MYSKYIYLLLIISSCILLLTACGRGRTTNENEEYTNTNEYAISTDIPSANEPLIRTLTILTTNIRNPGDRDSVDIIKTAESVMQRDWQGREEAFSIEIDSLDWADWHGQELRNQRLQMQLMAGQGPDIIFFDRQNIRAIAQSGFLIDFYELIDQDPYIGRGDFFTQALSAFEMHGGLYTLPVSFGFEYVGINANLPQHIIDEFTQKSTITIEEIMNLYLTLMDMYQQEFGHLTMGIPLHWNFTRFRVIRDDPSLSFLSLESSILLEAIMGNFIDFDTRNADLTNPRFISNVTSMRRILERDACYNGFRMDTPWVTGTITSGDANMRARADQFVFNVVGYRPNPINAFITPETPQFLHYIPFVDNQGRLQIIVNPFAGGASYGGVWTNISITAAADTELAWEFIQHVLKAYAMEGTRSIATSIQRENFDILTQVSISSALDRLTSNFPTVPNFIGQADPDQRALIVEGAVQRIAAYNEMPMSLLTTFMPSGLYEENLDLFIRGVIPPEEFAQRLQNSVQLWLIE